MYKPVQRAEDKAQAPATEEATDVQELKQLVKDLQTEVVSLREKMSEQHESLELLLEDRVDHDLQLEKHDEELRYLLTHHALRQDAIRRQLLIDYRDKMVERAPETLMTTEEKIAYLRDSGLSPSDEWALTQLDKVSKRFCGDVHVAQMKDAISLEGIVGDGLAEMLG